MNDRRSPASYSELFEGLSRVLITEQEIQARVHELGIQISDDYSGRRPLLIGVLKGVFPFMADLIRAITIPVTVDFMAISSYTAADREKGLVRLTKDLEEPITDRHVLFVEDVVDTGMTLRYLLENLGARKPASLKVCTCFDKPRRREVDVPIEYRGFELPDYFVVGYGLDYREYYRNLPFIGLLKPETFQSPVADVEE